MDAVQSMSKFLIALGCRQRGTDYILDGFSHDFYLRFDADDDPETPDVIGTVDIYIVDCGDPPRDSRRIVGNATRHVVMRFLIGIGVERFSEQTRQLLRESNSVIRTK